MIDEPRVDAYRRIVEGETQRNDDIDDIARQIDDLRRERNRRSQQEYGEHKNGPALDSQDGGDMKANVEARLDYGQSLETDPFADLSERELEELDLSPYEIDFTALSSEQQIRYWSLLSPGEKLCMVRLHLEVDLEEIARSLQLPTKVLKLLEEDKFALLPSSSVTMRSYYRAYASELGIEPSQLIKQYEVLTGQSTEQQKKQSFGMLTSFKPWQKKFMWSTAVAFAIGLVLILFAVRGSWMTPAPTSLSVGAWDAIDDVPVDQKADTGVIYGSSASPEASTNAPTE